MADDLDALLTRADRWRGHSPLADDLADALRECRADYLAALDVIARLSEGWDAIQDDNIARGIPTWWRLSIVAEEEDDDCGPDPMSDREWRVYCHAAQRATHGNQT